MIWGTYFFSKFASETPSFEFRIPQKPSNKICHKVGKVKLGPFPKLFASFARNNFQTVLISLEDLKNFQSSIFHLRASLIQMSSSLNKSYKLISLLSFKGLGILKCFNCSSNVKRTIFLVGNHEYNCTMPGSKPLWWRSAVN